MHLNVCDVAVLPCCFLFMLVHVRTVNERQGSLRLFLFMRPFTRQRTRLRGREFICEAHQRLAWGFPETVSLPWSAASIALVCDYALPWSAAMHCLGLRCVQNPKRKMSPERGQPPSTRGFGTEPTLKHLSRFGLDHVGVEISSAMSDMHIASIWTALHPGHGNNS